MNLFVFISLILHVSYVNTYFVSEKTILHVSHANTYYVSEKAIYKNSEIINVMLLYTSYYATILVKHHESQFSTLLNTSCYATTPDKNHKQSLLSKKLGHFMAAVWSICLVRMYDSAG